MIELPGTDPSLRCDIEQSTSVIEGQRGIAIKCPIGTLRGFTDGEGGTWVPGRPRLLNFNLSAGNSEHPGYVVVTPDVGKGLIVEDGSVKKLLLLRGRRYGRSEFRIPIWFRRGLIACDWRGCVDVMRRLRAR